MSNQKDELPEGRNHPETPKPDFNDQPPRAARLKAAQSLITAAMICGPISLIIGGVLLSTIAVTCAAIAYGKLRGLEGLSDPGSLEFRLRRQSMFMIAICVMTLVLNAISLAQVMPLVMDAIQSGNYTSILGASSVGTSSSASSAWG